MMAVNFRYSCHLGNFLSLREFKTSFNAGKFLDFFDYLSSSLSYLKSYIFCLLAFHLPFLSSSFSISLLSSYLGFVTLKAELDMGSLIQAHTEGMLSREICEGMSKAKTREARQRQ